MRSPWTHPVCLDCWEQRDPGREPVRVRDVKVEWCCLCGRPTGDGVYVRADPREFHPDGDSVHAE